MKAAIINNNIVTEIKNINEQECSELSKVNQLVIDITEIYPQPEVGWIFDGINLISNGQISWKITRLALRNRLTLQELIAFYTLCQSNLVYQIMLDNLKTTTYVDLKRQDTQTAILSLVNVGVLTSERASVILNTEPTSVEVYRGE